MSSDLSPAALTGAPKAPVNPHAEGSATTAITELALLVRASSIASGRCPWRAMNFDDNEEPREQAGGPGGSRPSVGVDVGGTGGVCAC
jgi:hypothetical protein